MSLWMRLSLKNILMFIKKMVRARSFFLSSTALLTDSPILVAVSLMLWPTSLISFSIEEKKLLTVLPSAQLSMRTVGESRSTETTGNFTLPSAFSLAKFLANFLRLYASHSKLVCLWRTIMKSSFFIGMVSFGVMSITWNSRSTSKKVSSNTLGCCTFTATSRTFPSMANSGLSLALCTCATVPLATGSSSKVSKMSSMSLPKASLIDFRVCAKSWAGASQRSLDSALMMSSSNMSGRIEHHCANFCTEQPESSTVDTSILIQKERHSSLSVHSANVHMTAQGVKMTASHTARLVRT
mmetsp:Transcript_10987/g.20211  ORF Transcript_10987/g.20211 Transcript_10987/m.20211 type:complete len:297 (+) Transcript_10987:697-1587(+)